MRTVNFSYAVTHALNTKCPIPHVDPSGSLEFYNEFDKITRKHPGKKKMQGDSDSAGEICLKMTGRHAKINNQVLLCVSFFSLQVTQQLGLVI